MIARSLPREMTSDNCKNNVLFALEYNEKQECWHFNFGGDILYKNGWYPVCLMVKQEDADKFCNYIESKFPLKKGLKFMTVLEEFANFLNKTTLK